MSADLLNEGRARIEESPPRIRRRMTAIRQTQRDDAADHDFAGCSDGLLDAAGDLPRTARHVDDCEGRLIEEFLAKM